VARSGEPAAIDVALRARERYDDAVVQAMVYSYDDGVLLFECSTAVGGIAIDPGESVIRFELEALHLVPGAYTLGAIVTTRGSDRATAWWFGRTTLHVDSGPRSRGRFHAPYRWSVVRPVKADGLVSAGRFR
jgi:hypothetical protein